MLGDLTKEDAELFWNQRLLPHAEKHLENKPATIPDFEHIYSVCGGNMHLLKQMFWEQCISRGALLPEHFYMVTQEKAKLSRALFADNMLQKNKLLTIFEELVQSEERFLNYYDICHTHGKPVVDSLIQNNVLHLRPTKRFSDDLEFQVDGVPVVTPETPCGFVAMKQLVSEFEKEYEKE